MVRKAEVQRKRSPLFYVFGLLLAVGLFALAYGISGTFVVPRIASLNGIKNTATLALAVGIWVFLLAIAFFLVSVLVGKSPEDAANQMPLPPKAKDLRDKKKGSYKKR